MSVLESSVQTLANALDKLENSLDEKIADASADADAVVAARRQARAAKTHLAEASSGLGQSISELRALLNTADTQETSNGAS